MSSLTSPWRDCGYATQPQVTREYWSALCKHQLILWNKFGIERHVNFV